MGLGPTNMIAFAVQIILVKFDYMNNESAMLLEEKIARLQGYMNQLQTEKLKMHAEIDILTKEKTILMNALERYAEMEETLELLQTKNIQLESQLNSLVGSIEKMEQGL
jgi:chromosome segregation ATPase